MESYIGTEFFLDSSTREDGTDGLSLNVCDYQRTLLNFPKERRTRRKCQSRAKFESCAQWSEVQCRAVTCVTERTCRIVGVYGNRLLKLQYYGKGKGHPMTYAGTKGRRSIAPTHIHPALRGCGSEASRFVPFNPGKDPIAVVQEADWGRCGQARKI